MMSNGNVLTANTGYHKTETDSMLSDILERDPDPRYFLSARAIRAMKNHAERHKSKGNGFGVHILDASMPIIPRAAGQEP